jgi:hypothetical protein
MAENLVIVESPAKAKTIEKFLGKEFLVKSSFGHIRDLAKKEFGINIKKNYEPHYIISPDKKKVVTELKKLAQESGKVWLASDEDREGRLYHGILPRCWASRRKKPNGSYFMRSPGRPFFRRFRIPGRSTKTW